ncbi:putative cytochrome P450 [Bipolaris maydis]|nr:cytochrome P450 [Bipolaris maydis]KAJ5051257.1 putative cytochrome P450 [Bipolaris maydis]KAJ5059779.1 putative cytochrome P450 [Bipolaris maydis]KAJ6197253.1 putative cytochrome P450 [Bipolaris maydis]KAJ6209774.1 putative cytochrome P450 [Bipolaris maydis]
MDHMNESASVAVNHQHFNGKFSSSSATTFCIYILLIGYCTSFVLKAASQSKHVLRAPYAGYRSIFEPAFLVRLRFSKGAQPQINEGYRKFKDAIFRLSRNDRDLVVIPNKYVDELRNLSHEKLNSVEALIANICGPYTASEIMLEGNLHTHLLQTKLTPNLAAYSALMKEEADQAMDTLIPECKDEWIQVRIYEVLAFIIARISNRVFLGEHDGRNEEWFHASMGYAREVAFTVMVMRCFPPWMRPAVAMCLPSSWRLHAHMRQARKALLPIISRRRQAQCDPDYVKPNDFLQWMMDNGVGDEQRPEKLAQRQLILILASVDTTTRAGAHAIYDMCARPEYFDPLREEVETVLREDGGWGKPTLTRMRKMDSFLKESQRLSPASLLSFHRIVKTPITLSDGTQLPQGTHICLASEATSKDPSLILNADTFDGFRYYNMRQILGQEHKHQFATTDKNHLHFGHGKYACPGRFFASNELKVVLASLITRYDMKYPEGVTRPANLNADEFLYSDPSTTVLLRRRK